MSPTGNVLRTGFFRGPASGSTVLRVRMYRGGPPFGVGSVGVGPLEVGVWQLDMPEGDALMVTKG